ncbi:unnamed protein product [Alternaria alternata]
MAAEQAREELVGTLKSLLESGDYSDFVITCGTDTYNVHKNVVCTRAGFFKGAERFTTGQEAAAAKADLSEDEPEIVKLLVQYLYEGEYDIKLTDMAHSAQPVLLVNAKMYEIGDKYDVLGLKQLALAKFSLACETYWESQQFAPAAHYAFSTTPESDKGLRDIVTKTIADHTKTLNSPAVEALLNEFNGLVTGVLKMRAKDLGWI